MFLDNLLEYFISFLCLCRLIHGVWANHEYFFSYLAHFSWTPDTQIASVSTFLPKLSSIHFVQPNEICKTVTENCIFMIFVAGLI